MSPNGFPIIGAQIPTSTHTDLDTLKVSELGHKLQLRCFVVQLYVHEVGLQTNMYYLDFGWLKYLAFTFQASNLVVI